MAPTPTAKSNTKPLKPYRRGETLGKASRAGKAAKPTQAKPRAKQPVVVAAKAPAAAESEEEEEEEVEEEEEEEVGSEGEGEAAGEEDEDEAASPVPEAPVRRKKKGKKFVESQVRQCQARLILWELTA